MTKQMVIEILDILKQGKEPYFSDEGWTEFYRLLMEIENERSVEQSA